MPLAWKSTSPLRPHTVLETQGATLRFFLGDCLDVLSMLEAGSVSVVVTSPPYNLGIRYRSYDDSLPQQRYLEWTESWVKATTRALSAEGSLFLNVGAKPTDPWTAMDVAQTARKHLQLQNTIHWVKSIAIDRESAGAGAALDRDLAVGHYKPINSDRFLNDCHEFIFHFTPGGTTRLDRLAIGVPYQDASNIARWRTGSGNRRCRGNTWFIPYQTIQSRDKDGPTLRRSLHACRSTASGSMGCRTLPSSSTPSSASAARPWRAPGSAWTSSVSRWTSTTSRPRWSGRRKLSGTETGQVESENCEFRTAGQDGGLLGPHSDK